ncbi:serine/threonine-protein kinase [Streptomyces apocyni]|uniref:serine/threonine-protein kinase n=1 Tax=Streptomyces apocyni TaxID=2654677 RepID=UPI0012EA08FB|nr:serine/threonine-protein kinase [Streptomyces apocyni]
MSNDGGSPYGPNEPTSFTLRPPQPPGGNHPYAQQPAGPQPVDPQPGHPAPHAVPTQVAQQAPVAPQPPAQSSPAQSPAAPQDPGAGRLIAGRYRLLSKLGHGGMGTVWRAKDETVDREVAVKEPRIPDHLPERERATAFERMRREARAAARLDHPAVVSVHDVAVEDGQPWIVMEFVQGRSMGAALQEGTLGVREAARIGLEVLNALDAAHQAGVLHRDVKPDNVMLGRHDRVVLTDFGIAQIAGETNLTDTGSFIGSPEFISPERVLGQRPGPASDLWALGVVLYAATEGVSPFRRSNPPATLQAVLNATPAAPAAAQGPLADAINQLLAKDPSQRPNAAQVRQLLEAAANPPQPVPQPATQTVRAPGGRGDGGRSGIWVGRKTLLAVGAAVVAVAVAVVLVITDPFASSTSEADSWKERSPKGFGATLALPEHYQELPRSSSSSDEQRVNYADPSGAIVVELDVNRKADDKFDRIASTASAQASKDLEDIKSGSTSLINAVKDPAPDGEYTPNVPFQGEEKAAENLVTYANSRISLDPDKPAPRETRFFYYRSDEGDMYRVRIDYPGKGDFAERGREVAQSVLDKLEIGKE